MSEAKQRRTARPKGGISGRARPTGAGRGRSRIGDQVDRIWQVPYGWPVLGTAALALVGRLVINIAFWIRFGSHASSIVEVWYYTANPVRRTFALQPWDPTTPILSAAMGLDPGDPLHEVVVTGWLLVVVTVALMCLAGREIYRLGSEPGDGDEELRARRFGVASGLLYAFSTKNLSITLASFTHDLVAFPFCAAVLWGVARIGNLLRRREGSRRLSPWILMTGASFFLGTRVGPTIIGVMGGALAGVALILVLGRLFAAAPRIRRALTVGLPALCFAGLLILALHPSFAATRDRLRDRVYAYAAETRDIDARAQADAGAEDLNPLTARKALVSYHFLFLLVPPALWIAWRRREAVSLSILAVAVPGMAVFSRLSRLAEFGIALVLAGPLALRFAARRRKWLRWMVGCYVVALYLCLAGMTGRQTVPERLGSVLAWLAGDGRGWWPALLAITCFGGAMVVVLLLANRSREEHRSHGRGLVAAALVLLVAGVFFQIMWPKSRTTQAEWQALRDTRAFVADRPSPGRMLIPWSDGLMAWAITGLDAVSHVERIDRAATLLYWCHEDEAAERMREQGIGTVFWSARYLAAAQRAGRDGRPVVTRVSAPPELFFGESGWNERNQAESGDPNMPYTLISLMGQPRDRLAGLLPDFTLIAEASDRRDPSRPAARVFAVNETPAPSYTLPRPGIPSPALAAIRELEAAR